MTEGPAAGASLPPAFLLRALSLGHGSKRVIEPTTVTVPAGARVLVVGANGSGKSTLLATMAGLLPALDGKMEVLGLDPLEERRRLHAQTGHLGHTDPFYPELSGRENLGFYAKLHGLPENAVEHGLQRVGLQSEADRSVAQFSHGMRRRLGLAKALLGTPRLLLLDEPDAGLDREARARLATHLQADDKTTVVLSSHHAHDHLPWASVVWVLGGGRLVTLDGQKERVSAKRLDAALREVDV